MPDQTELRDALEDASIVFGDPDLDQIQVLFSADDLVVKSASLSRMVDAHLELTATPEERDELLDLARMFTSLAKRIRNVIYAIEAEAVDDPVRT